MDGDLDIGMISKWCSPNKTSCKNGPLLTDSYSLEGTRLELGMDFFQLY